MDISKEQLKELYINQNLNSNQIAKLYHVDCHKILNLIKQYNLIKNPLPTKEQFQEFYINQNLTIKQLSKKFNRTEKTISNLIKQYNLVKYPLPTKNQLKEEYQIKKLRIHDIARKYHVDEHKISDLLKQYNITRDLLPTKEELKELYINQKLTIHQIAKKYCVDLKKISDLIQKYNITKNFYTSSNKEVELYKLFPQFNIHSNWLLLDNKYEIDLYNEQYKIGIEFNGNYWHSEYIKSNNHHQLKSQYARSKNIFLFHIFEYEWNNECKRPILISMINNLINNNQNKIYARKCIIKEVNQQDKELFLNQNHLQGNCNSTINLGLYYNGELISLMTFGKPRFRKDYEYELLRFCNKLNTIIIGGASKLFRYFIDNYNPKSILSYSDIAKTKGNLYNILGFKLQSISKPGYVWCNNVGNILTRYQCQKHKLIKQDYNKDLTEIEIMHNRNYYKIYDCGQKIWIWNI